MSLQSLIQKELRQGGMAVTPMEVVEVAPARYGSFAHG